MERNSKAKMWESFRADARREDAEIENKISQLETQAASSEAAAAYAALERAQETALSSVRHLQTVVKSMSDLVTTMRREGGTDPAELATMSKHTQRFDEVVLDKSTTIRRLMIDARRRREKAELLTKVHTQIAVHDDETDTRHLTSEQESLRHTQRRTRELLEQAAENRAKLREQRNMFTGIGDKALGIAEQVPVVKDLLKRIDAKRRREAVILAIIIALCFVMVFMFW
jgi:Golgi SNAP receptor complex protein 1